MARQVEEQPKIIGPTPEEIQQANEGEFAPRGITNLLLKITKHPAARITAVGGAVLGGAYATYENIPAVHQPIDKLIHGVSQPRNNLEKTMAQKVVERNIRNGVYEMDELPPGRQAEDLSKIPSSLNKEDIPDISEDFVFPGSLPESINTSNVSIVIPPSVTVGFNAFPEGEWWMHGQKGEIGMKESLIPPYAVISGILVAKEKQPDGSIFFAIELPYSDSPKDILERDPNNTIPQAATKTRNSSGLENAKSFEQTTVEGVIVWIRLFEGTNPTHYPLVTSVSWENDESRGLGIGIHNGDRAGSGAEALAKHARIGDPIRANIPLSIDPDSDEISDSLDKYVNLYNYADSVDELKQKLGQTSKDNMNNAQNLINDSGQTIPMEDQLRGKKYTFTANTVNFWPK